MYLVNSVVLKEKERRKNLGQTGGGWRRQRQEERDGRIEGDIELEMPS
jgi:hypothetical protein